MFQLTFLGTGASIPTACRNSSATLVNYNGIKFLIDAAEGTQRQLRLGNIGFKGLEYILLTHQHGDHIFGLGSLFFTFCQVPPPKQVKIFGNDLTLQYVKILAEMVWGSNKSEQDQAIELVCIPPDGLIHDSEDIQVVGFPVTHGRHESYGFSFYEKPHRKFLVDEAERLAIPLGPERGRLSRGEPVTLSDGRVIEPSDVLGPWVHGAKLTYVGDCGYDTGLIDHARNADCLVLEATFLNKDEDLATEHGHLTARQAGQIARQAGVKALYLNHRSPRYTDEEILQEATKVFSGAQVAVDFERLDVQAIR